MLNVKCVIIIDAQIINHSNICSQIIIYLNIVPQIIKHFTLNISHYLKCAVFSFFS